jgi:hypothetical protein
MTEAKAFRIFITIFYLLKSERFSGNIKLTLHKALIRTVITYACPAWELAAVGAKQGSLHHRKFSKVHTDPRFAHSF